MSFTEVLRNVYSTKKFVKQYMFTDGKNFFDDPRDFNGIEKLIKEYNLEREGFDFSFVNLRNGLGRLIIELRNGDVITHDFEL